MDKKSQISLTILTLISVLSLISLILFNDMSATRPKIQGAILPQPKNIPAFELLDHNGRLFNNKNLLGKWHLVNYGYTHCPDVCPTTLTALASMVDKLHKYHHFQDVDILFYSIDHQRDTAARLKEYLPFFNKKFIGLTYENKNRAKALVFENSLGMTSVLTPIKEQHQNQTFASYQVSHGILLYLLNPEGQLQAVFKPDKNKDGTLSFDAHRLFNDYVKLRRFFG